MTCLEGCPTHGRKHGSLARTSQKRWCGNDLDWVQSTGHGSGQGETQFGHSLEAGMGKAAMLAQIKPACLPGSYKQTRTGSELQIVLKAKSRFYV